MKWLVTIALTLVCSLAGAYTASVRSNTDLGGGGLPVKPKPTTGHDVRLGAVSLGLVVEGGSGVPVSGAVIQVFNSIGSPVAVAVSSDQGTFGFATPTAGPLFLDVLGTSVTGVPFDPGEAIVIVLP